MSDDLFDTLGTDAAFEEEEQQPEDTGEKQNKTFLIAVAIMGGLLVLALVAFGVWALVINPQMKRAANQAAQGLGAGETPAIETPATEEIIATPTVEEAPTEEKPTAAPTNTPKPTPTLTPTPLIGPTATPESSEAAAGGGEATPTPTPRVRRTDTPAPTPTKAPASAATPRPTAAAGGTTQRTPETGFGEVALVAAAVLLVGVFFTARRLRKA
ncbi:MAG TPA: hypothetical protein PKZ84_16485 [Anaerolineae bacterium]|nr:hypothetical protein [Anaerolineae bacterium]HQI86243.1 hypothetical protein [Anaerolineae bacterium]